MMQIELTLRAMGSWCRVALEQTLERTRNEAVVLEEWYKPVRHIALFLQSIRLMHKQGVSDYTRTRNTNTDLRKLYTRSRSHYARVTMKQRHDCAP